MVKKVWGKDDCTFTADFRLGGRRVRLTGFPTERAARDAIKKAQSEFERGTFIFAADRQRITIRTLGEAWLTRHRERKSKASHVRMAERAFEHLARIVDLELEATELAPAHFTRYMKMRDKDGAKPATAFKELIQLEGACRHSKKYNPGLAAWSPPVRPESITRPTSKRERVITRHEEREIILALKFTETSDLFTLALETGARVGELLRISRFDLLPDPTASAPYGQLVLHATKTARAGQTKDRTIPLTRRGRSILDRRLELGELAFRPGLVYVYDAHLREACAQAGIAYGTKNKGGLVFHDTRHTAITRMINAGNPLPAVQYIVGQRTVNVTMGYAHATAETLGAAIQALEELQPREA